MSFLGNLLVKARLDVTDGVDCHLVSGDFIVDSGDITLTAGGLALAAGTLTAEQLTSTDDLTVAGLATIGETLGVTGVVTGATNINSTAGNIIAVAGDVVAGSSGNTGVLASYPVTASKGRLNIAATDNIGNTNNNITNEAMVTTRTFTIPEPGRPAANFMLNTPAERYELSWVAGQRGKPGVNTDVDSATPATMAIADPDFELLGANAVSSDSAYFAEGGITISSHGGGTDATILVPHVDTSQSAWSSVTWGTDNEVIWECRIRTGAAITLTTIWAGLKLTNTEVSDTNDDQVFFRYQNGVNSGKWQCVSDVGGAALVEADSGAAAVAINTDYHLAIVFDAAGEATMYIDGVLVETAPSFTGAHADLIPYIGILEAEASAKNLTIRSQAISRVVA